MNMASYQKAKENGRLKVVMLGAMGAGKTTLLYRYTNRGFVKDQPQTIGVGIFNLNWNDKTFTLWDTAGEERFRHSITTTYCRDATAAILVYDVMRRRTFQDLQDNFIRLLPETCLLKVVVAAKCDMLNQLTGDQRYTEGVSQSEGIQLARMINPGFQSCDLTHPDPYFETSSKQDVNVTEAFEFVLKSLAEIGNNEERLGTDENGGVVVVVDNPDPNDRKCKPKCWKTETK